MELSRTLTLIQQHFKDFSDLSQTFTDIINKDEFYLYLLNKLNDYPKELEYFLNIIYDENEEDRQNITTQHFLDKYHNLLTLIQEDSQKDNTTEEKQNIDNNPIDKQNTNKDDENKDNAQPNNDEENILLNLLKDSKDENNLAENIIDANDKEEKDIKNSAQKLLNELKNSSPSTSPKVKVENNNNIADNKSGGSNNKSNGSDNNTNSKFSTIVRPSNDFHFGLNSNKDKRHTVSKINFFGKEEIKNTLNMQPSKKIIFNQINSNLDFDFDLELHKKKKKNQRNERIDSLKNDLKIFEDNFYQKRQKAKAKTGYSTKTIKQKLHDVFLQIQSPKDTAILTNPFPTSTIGNYPSYSSTTTVSSKTNNPLAMSTNLYSRQQTQTQTSNSIINPYNLINEKINNFQNNKNKGRTRNYEILSSNKYMTKINNKPDKNKEMFYKKFKNLNDILNAKPDDNVIPNEYGNILSEDDFITLEEKIESFENMRKQNKKSIIQQQKEKEIFDEEFSQINCPNPNNEIENDSHNLDFVSEISDLINNDEEGKL